MPPSKQRRVMQVPHPAPRSAHAHACHQARRLHVHAAKHCPKPVACGAHGRGSGFGLCARSTPHQRLPRATHACSLGRRALFPLGEKSRAQHDCWRLLHHDRGLHKHVGATAGIHLAGMQLKITGILMCVGFRGGRAEAQGSIN